MMEALTRQHKIVRKVYRREENRLDARNKCKNTKREIDDFRKRGGKEHGVTRVTSRSSGRHGAFREDVTHPPDLRTHAF
jgi:hypothetical protein